MSWIKLAELFQATQDVVVASALDVHRLFFRRRLKPLFVRYLQVTRFSAALQRVAEAIEVLRRGDLDRVMGAGNLPKQLSIWYKFYHNGNPNPSNPSQGKPNRGRSEESKDEKKRTLQLISQIGELLPLSSEFRDPEKKKKTGRYRRRRLAKSQAVAASVAAEGDIMTCRRLPRRSYINMHLRLPVLVYVM
jgi:hypothetical protein